MYLEYWLPVAITLCHAIAREEPANRFNPRIIHEPKFPTVNTTQLSPTVSGNVDCLCEY